MSWASRVASREVPSVVDDELAVDVDAVVLVDAVLADEFDRSLIRALKSLFNVDSVEVEELLELPLRALVISFSKVVMSLLTAELVDDEVLSLLDAEDGGGGGGGGGPMALAAKPSEEDELDDVLSELPPKALAMSLSKALMSLLIAELVDDEVLSLLDAEDGGGGGGRMAPNPPPPSDELDEESPTCCAWSRAACMVELIDWNAEARSLALTPLDEDDDEEDDDEVDEDDDESIALVRVSYRSAAWVAPTPLGRPLTNSLWLTLPSLLVSILANNDWRL